MGAKCSAAVWAAAVVAGLVGSVSPPAKADDPVTRLRRQAAEARSRLEADTQRLEDEQRSLARSRGALTATLKALGAAQAEYDRVREPLARLINSAFQSGVTGSMSVLAGPRSSGVAADLTYLAERRQALVSEADTFRVRRQELAAQAQDQQSRELVDQAATSRDIDALKQQSDQVTRQLTQALGKVGPEGRTAVQCDPGLVADARKFPNGLIPAKYLCLLPQAGRKLRADAALSFYRLNAAYRAHFGSDMCLRDSYRSLADQQRVFANRPGFAAIPGRSNHGLGTAVDICGGVENPGSPQFGWMAANSARFGWIHPAWAYSSPFEPWHWEFKTDAGSEALPDLG